MKPTDTQMVILTADTQREDSSIHPLPKTLKGGAVTKVTQALLRRGLIAEAPGREDCPGRRDPYFAVTAEGASRTKLRDPAQFVPTENTTSTHRHSNQHDHSQIQRLKNAS